MVMLVNCLPLKGWSLPCIRMHPFDFATRRKEALEPYISLGPKVVVLLQRDRKPHSQVYHGNLVHDYLQD